MSKTRVKNCNLQFGFANFGNMEAKIFTALRLGRDCKMQTQR